MIFLTVENKEANKFSPEAAAPSQQPGQQHRRRQQQQQQQQQQAHSFANLMPADMDDDAALQMALKMSMEQTTPAVEEANSDEEDLKIAMEMSLEGVKSSG